MYIRSLNITTDRVQGFPYNTEAVRYAKHINLDQPVTFIVGDNGVGKSSLIEAIAYKLHLARINNKLGFQEESFEHIAELAEDLELDMIRDGRGFFFRSEDFGDYVIKGNIFDSFESQNPTYQNMMFNYGQNLASFSHGEAFLHIITQRVKRQGIYIFDEPESALSPLHQLSLIYFIREHLKKERSQFIIATHSPILMAMPDALIYEVTKNGMQATPLQEVEHYIITKTFLNNPKAYFRED